MRPIDADELRKRLEDGVWNDAVAEVDAMPTIKAVPLREIYRIIAGHSNYHGDNILAAMTCITEGKEVKPIRPIEAAPEVQGEWSVVDKICGVEILKCSVCGKEHATLPKPYCCYCGAKMKGGAE